MKVPLYGTLVTPVSTRRSREMSDVANWTDASKFSPSSINSVTRSPLKVNELQERLSTLARVKDWSNSPLDGNVEDYEPFDLPTGVEEGENLSHLSLSRAPQDTCWPNGHDGQGSEWGLCSAIHPAVLPWPAKHQYQPFQHWTSSSSTDEATPSRETSLAEPLSLNSDMEPVSTRARPIKARPMSSAPQKGPGPLVIQNDALPNLRSKRLGRKSKIHAPTSQSRRQPERQICHICEMAGVKSKISFKGQHEFARHHNKKHSDEKRQWICLDPTPDKRHSWCKRCREGKLYAVNYNAAEHLRRAHLNPDGSEKSSKKSRGSLRVPNDAGNIDRSQRYPQIQWMIRKGYLGSVYSSNSSAAPNMNAAESRSYSVDGSDGYLPWSKSVQSFHDSSRTMSTTTAPMTAPLPTRNDSSEVRNSNTIFAEGSMNDVDLMPHWNPSGYVTTPVFSSQCFAYGPLQ